MKHTSIVRSIVLFLLPLASLAACTAPCPGDLGAMQAEQRGSRVRLTTTVQRSSAAGTVTSDFGGIQCTPRCWSEYDAGAKVTLTAKSVGTAVLTATAGGFTQTVNVEVK